MFADEIRRQAEAAPRAALPALAAALWRAFAEEQVSEAEAEALSALIEERKAIPATAGPARRPTGSRPRSDASMARRRRWAASGWLPPQLATRFTQAEAAVLAVVAAEVAKRGDCRLYHGHVAALAGVARSTVRATLRRARELGAITVEERRASAWRNLANVVRIASREWLAWCRLVRLPVGRGGGDLSSAPTSTQNLDKSHQRPAEASQRAAGGQGRARARPHSDSGPGPSRRVPSMR
ncbi:hypothetical protein MKK70_00210 [Methylobacterium sp. E-041]|nr:hypothetical protein [Methylobacterium sp. E-041]